MKVPTLFEYNGTAVQPGTMGWYATLFMFPPNGAQNKDIHMCGGVVLSEYWVLTAGHCVEGFESITVYPASQGNGMWPDIGQFNSISIMKLPAYDNSHRNGAQDDIGIVRLATPIPSAVTARLDLTGSLWAALPDGAPLFSSGHGLTCAGSGSAEGLSKDPACISRTLMVSTLPKVSTARCETTPKYSWSPQVVGGAICAGYQGIDLAPQPCEGDSGGPLFDSNGTVYALVSRGDGSLGCGHSQLPTLFAPVSRAAAFLLAQIFAPPPAGVSRTIAVGHAITLDTPLDTQPPAPAVMQPPPTASAAAPWKHSCRRTLVIAALVMFAIL